MGERNDSAEHGPEAASASPPAGIHPKFAVHGQTQAPSLWPEFLTGQPERPVRVLLIDDDPHIRRVMAQELVADLRITLVGQAGSAREGRRLIASREFDVMMIDLSLGDGSGFDLIEQMKALRPEAEAIVVSALEDEQHALRAFELGATGYLLKNSWFGNFPQAVLQVVNGGASITPNLARRLLGRLELRPGSAPQRSGADADPLSGRETEVLKMVANGYTSVEIGKRLSISGQTVNTHVKNIYRKLRVSNRAQAVSFAGARGLLV
ncbi:MAG: Two-component transcriptional response regulator, LuxR family [Burkholderiaceae bacterium]|nr:MAG: Two-component transcriptional response regulator, LuxR family [Burkholderiaceae bacterium]